MSDDDYDLVTCAIAAGFVVALGYGVYRVLKAFGEHDKGDEISEEELIALL